MSKLAAFIANTLYIRPLCMAKDGVIDVYEKPRTRKGALNKLVDTMGKLCTSTENKKCIISHCNSKEDAENLKLIIDEKYNFKEVIISEMRGLCSFYALENGIIVSF